MFGRSKSPDAAAMRRQVQERQTAQAANLEEWFEQNLAPLVGQGIRLYVEGEQPSSYRYWGQDSMCPDYQAGYWWIGWSFDKSLPSGTWPAVSVAASKWPEYQRLLRWVQRRYQGYRLVLFSGSPGACCPWNGEFYSIQRNPGHDPSLVIAIRPD